MINLHNYYDLKNLLQSKHNIISYQNLIFYFIENNIEAEFLDYIDFFGNYKSKLYCSKDDLNSIFELTNKLKINQLSFALSLFEFEITKLDCHAIQKKINHHLFDDIRVELRVNLLEFIVKNSRIPEHLHSSNLSLLIPSFIDNGNIISGDIFKKCIQEYLMTVKNKNINTGLEFANKIKEDCLVLQDKYETPLYNLFFSDFEIEKIRILAFFYITKAKYNFELQNFLKVWDGGGLLLLSCIIFAKNTDKDKNRDFWKAYFNWIGLPFTEYSSKIQKIYCEISNFIRANNVAIVETNSGASQYVVTFRMHSLIANRPSSRRKIIKFLIRLCKLNGLNYHDTQEQREFLQIELDHCYNKYLSKNDEVNLVLPIETLKAYAVNKIQLVDFLLPIYKYLEKVLIDKLYDYESNYSVEKLQLPRAFISDLEFFVHKESSHDIKMIKEVLRQNKTRKSSVYFNIEYCEIEYVVAGLIIETEEIDDLENLIITLEYRLEKESKLNFQKLNYQEYDSFIVTNEVYIPCNSIGKDLDYIINFDGKKKSGKIKFDYIFDSEGNPINLNSSKEQEVYCISTPSDILADNLELVVEKFQDDYNVYKSYIDENSFIIIGNKIFGYESNILKSSGYIIQNSIYNRVKIVDVDNTYQVIGEFPLLYFRCSLDYNVKEDLILSINSVIIDFNVIESKLIPDGKEESIVKIKINKSTNNYLGKKVVIKIFDNKAKKNIFEESFVVLTSLQYKFSKDYYIKESNICVQTLDFDNKKEILAGHYQFPNLNHLYSFKINLDESSIVKLVLPRPFINISIKQDSIFKKSDYWFKELVDYKSIHIDIPKEIRNLKLITRDDEKIIHHRLKKKGKNNFNLFYLNEFPNHGKNKVKLCISFTVNNEEFIEELCTIYYKVSLMNSAKLLTYIPNNPEFHFKGFKPGLTIKPSIICDPNEEYIFSLYNSEKRLIFSRKLNELINKPYWQKNDLTKDEYCLKVFSVKANPFLRTLDKVEVLSQVFRYKFNEKQKLNDNSQVKKIKIYNPMYKELCRHNSSIISLNQYIKPFYLFLSNNLYFDKEFKTSIFIYNTRIKKFNRFGQEKYIVKVVKKLNETDFIFKILDAKRYPLVVDCLSGKIVANKNYYHRNLQNLKYFKGSII
ncbi:MAG: hypothetical protein OWP43_12935 [Sphaerochaetaceae bacterium]|nr:hypothetical protein [Sphaerochaetaceae bacterium]